MSHTPPPASARIGHHIWFTGPLGWARSGDWGCLEMDYIRVWTWQEGTPTPTPEPVTEVRLTARYPRLVYYGPDLGLPAQTLDVAVVGGTPPYDAVVYVVPPSGVYTPVDYTASSNPWAYGPGESGNLYLGVEETGTWLGRVVVNGTPSNIVSWEVHWYPAHVVR